MRDFRKIFDDYQSIRNFFMKEPDEDHIEDNEEDEPLKTAAKMRVNRRSDTYLQTSPDVHTERIEYEGDPTPSPVRKSNFNSYQEASPSKLIIGSAVKMQN